MDIALPLQLLVPMATLLILFLDPPTNTVAYGSLLLIAKWLIRLDRLVQPV